MVVLFIDTHSPMLNVGIVEDGKLLKEISLMSHMEHSSRTLTTVKNALDELKMKPNDIDKIMVINGPGSYTGLRIGVTISKTYAYALEKTVIPVSSLKAAALSATEFDYVITKIDAKREHSFAAIYDNKYNEILVEQYISNSELEDKINSLTGNIKVMSDSQQFDILKIVDYYKDSEGVSPHSLVPNYLKDTYVEMK